MWNGQVHILWTFYPLFTEPLKFMYIYIVRPVHTCWDNWCKFLLLIDAKERMVFNRLSVLEPLYGLQVHILLRK